MLSIGQLNHAFNIYWDEINRCITGKAFWSLLHVVVCLPDICAALQSSDGKAKPELYKNWCERYLIDPILSKDERYLMRCKILHQGRASTDNLGRYDGFAFTQPAVNGQVYHKQVEEKENIRTLVLDVGEMAKEVKKGVEDWIEYLEANVNSRKAINVQRNLNTLVQVRPFHLPQVTTFPMSTVDIVNRSS